MTILPTVLNTFHAVLNYGLLLIWMTLLDDQCACNRVPTEGLPFAIIVGGFDHLQRKDSSSTEDSLLSIWVRFFANKGFIADWILLNKFGNKISWVANNCLTRWRSYMLKKNDTKIKPDVTNYSVILGNRIWDLALTRVYSKKKNEGHICTPWRIFTELSS